MCENPLQEIAAPLLEWYHINHRILPWRQDRDAYHVWVSEIMLQQTRVDAVVPYYERFIAQLPDIRALADCADDRLMKLWEGLGYYSRVRNMKKAARLICEQYGGIFPENVDEILRLPGIGAYTAGAIASIAFEQPVAAVDGNVLRVVTRLTEDGSDIADTGFRCQVTAALEDIYPRQECGDFTQSLMELGALVCIPNGLPKCTICPLQTLCGACKSGTQMQYPFRTKKAARRVEKKTILFLRYRNKIALRRRAKGGVLAGMWEFPNLDGYRTRKELSVWLAEHGIATRHIWMPVTVGNSKCEVKHIFTHIEWHMTYAVIDCADVTDENDFTWVTKEQLTDSIALPAAFRKVYGSALP